jgi:chromosome segregation protein
LGRLSEKVQLTNGLSAAASTLLPRLRSCYLVDGEDTARRLAVQHPSLNFLLPSGVCYSGYTVSGGKKTAAGPLALKRELRELQPRIQNIELALERAAAQAASAERQMAEQTLQVEAIRAQSQELEKSALAADQELRQSGAQAEKLERRLAVAGLERERLAHEQERAGAELEAKHSAIEQRDRERQETEDTLSTLREQIEQARQLRAQLAEEQTTLRTGLATLEERLKAATASLSRARNAVEDHEQRRERISEQIRSWEQEREQLLTDNAAIELRLQEGSARQGQLQAYVQAAIGSLEASRARTIELEAEVKAVRAALESVREQRSAIELSLVQFRSDLKHLAEASQRDLSRPIEEVAAEHGQSLTPEQLAEAGQRYEDLRAKLENLGPVNILALEEFKEASERLQFLETQRNDLLDSIRDTQKAIHEIDTASRRQFQVALDAINRSFREIFRTLFGGGIAEMRLTDPENPAESGIDIVASPPGKRLQNIALLSGGEKSLTALALLMAAFRFRPSPFCVLDEVDAALDDANVTRFRRLLEHMSDTTQFIIVTHNKTTMEAAETLYGITMAEPGVSHVVSVRMPGRETEAPEPEPKAVPVGA